MKKNEKGISQFKLLKLLILGLFFLNFKPIIADEFMFESLEKFGKINGYLAGFIVILQFIFVYYIIINLMLNALEMLGNPDIPKYLANIVSSIFSITLATILPSVILKTVRGMSFSGLNQGTGSSLHNELLQTEGFKLLFNFMKSANTAVSIIFLIMASAFFLLGAINYLANTDLASFIRQLVVTIIFVLLAIGFQGFTFKNGMKFKFLNGTEITKEMLVNKYQFNQINNKF